MTQHQRPSVWFVPEVQGAALAPSAPGLAAEACRAARALGCGTTAVLLGDGVSRLAPAVPADVVYLGNDNKLSGRDAEAKADALAPLLEEQAPSVLLLAATPLAGDLAPRLAARLGTGLAPGCFRLDVEANGRLLMLRPAFSGRASCTLSCRSRPQLATLLPEALPAGEPAAQGPPEIIPLRVCLDTFRPRLTIEGIERLPPSALDLSQAAVVVAGGRGTGGPQGFALLEELAELLGGAVAASRPAVDAGWAPPSRQVGSSGKQVAPRLYLACGISGASQHLAGMRDSELIVTIDRDPSAPLVAMADLALVGDLRELLSAILSRLRHLGVSPGEELPPSPFQEPGRPDGRRGPERIAVCLSRTPDLEAAFDPRQGVSVDALPHVSNAADWHAVEVALSIKDRQPPVHVVALHVGPPGSEGVLRQALALGADDAVLLWDQAFASSDSLATARILAAAVRRLGADLVLCGSRGGDGQSGQVPLQLGESLGAAALSRVLALEIDCQGGIAARQALEWGRQALVRCSLPAVAGVEAGINRPRYPRLRLALAAPRRPLAHWGLRELGLPEDVVGAKGSGIEVVNIGPPKPVTASSRVHEELEAEDRLRLLLAGGAATGASNIVRGPPEELARAFVDFLEEHALIRPA
ncbi:MAG TPA: FAD-binding protein [Dehalococcoidia bacterium]|nr:FAD-binding protein [Dehalococcoidia bacterium]